VCKYFLPIHNLIGLNFKLILCLVLIDFIIGLNLLLNIFIEYILLELIELELSQSLISEF